MNALYFAWIQPRLVVPPSQTNDLSDVKWRKRLRRDALEAWTEFKATGKHVTADEVDAWLAGLERGENVEPPIPRD